MIGTICVYCSSSSAVDERYVRAATEMGDAIGRAGRTLVFGGADVGLMGVLARATQAGGGRVVAVLPDVIAQHGLGFQAADETVVTADLRERKQVMEARADAFVALPGGFGTLDELLEVITRRQLDVHRKPIAILDTDGFYTPLANLFEHLYRQRFARTELRSTYRICTTVKEVLSYFESFTPEKPAGKWFDHR